MSIGKSVLVVDDDGEFCELVTRLLRTGGYHVVVAASGEAALAVLQAGFKPDAIILDVNMPGGMSGVRFCDEIKRVREFDHVPIVVMTDYEPAHLFGWVVSVSKDQKEELLTSLEKYTRGRRVAA